MRRLLLLRHAKSARPDGVADIDRPLARRGREAAARMGAYLADEALFPDLALVSPSWRTRETWEQVRPCLAENVATTFEPRVYEASADRLLQVLHEAETPAPTILMIGHNPGCQDLARLLIGHGDRYAFARLARKFPTAGLAVIDFAVEHWREVAPGGGRLDRFVTPESLGLEDGE
jgi:phosphohistidine phosphatase